MLDIQDYYELHLHKNQVTNKINQFDTFEVVIDRYQSGLGFSITGGIDSPVSPSDIHIYVSKIIQGGSADLNGKLCQGDAILKINQIDCKAVTHGSCVDILKRAGDQVKLLVGRKIKHDAKETTSLDLPPPMPGMNSSNSTLNDVSEVVDVQLVKSKTGLGFSIAGGVGNEHREGDDGIFVTKIIMGGAAYANGQLHAGDKLLSVDGQSLDSITHEEAVIKLTQTGQVVNLRVSRNRSTRISTSESLERLKTDDSTTSADSEVYEATVKGILTFTRISCASLYGL